MSSVIFLCTDTKYIGIWYSIPMKQGTDFSFPFVLYVGMAELYWLDTCLSVKFYIVISVNLNIAVHRQF